jgi:hypothetical protein
VGQEQLKQRIRGSCVEITALTAAASEHDIAVRDFKDPCGPVLTFTARQWRDFTTAVKACDLELSWPCRCNSRGRGKYDITVDVVERFGSSGCRSWAPALAP